MIAPSFPARPWPPHPDAAPRSASLTMSEPAWRNRFVVVAAVGGRLYPPSLGAVPHGDGFM
jgi:hypothetical protein